MIAESFSLLLCLVAGVLLVENRLRRLIWLCSLHGLLLAGLVIGPLLEPLAEDMRFHYLSVVVMILVFKVFLTPLILTRAAKQTDVLEDAGTRFSSMITMALLIATFAVAIWLSRFFAVSRVDATRLEVAYALMVIFTGGLTFILRTHWIPLIIGFILFENGLFMLATLLSTELPLGVEFGAFADAIVVIGVAAMIQLWSAKSVPQEQVGS